MYPKSFEKVSTALEKLPGVGVKTAQRYSFALLDFSDEELDEFVSSLKELKKIKYCEICGFLADERECEICKDHSRRSDSIMVVSYPQDVIAIEKTGMFHGLYHVLNGVISSSKGIYPEDLNIDSLLSRLSEGTKEVIIATSPTMDGEMTALYLDKLLKDRKVLVTRLAHGLPMGSNLDYADELTLIKAMNNRRKFED
ncbi:MAG: recombination mediator RecR [Parabacteroides sp.]|nr:recombination mediator RecR [Parabacteroides sp.]